MDDAARIEAFKRYLRIKYADNANGLKALVIQLGDGAAGDSVLINDHSFESSSARGVVTLEPAAKLQAATDVLAEMDPTLAPERPDYAYIRFGSGAPCP